MKIFLPPKIHSYLGNVKLVNLSLLASFSSCFFTTDFPPKGNNELKILFLFVYDNRVLYQIDELVEFLED